MTTTIVLDNDTFPTPPNSVLLGDDSNWGENRNRGAPPPHLVDHDVGSAGISSAEIEERLAFWQTFCRQRMATLASILVTRSGGEVEPTVAKDEKEIRLGAVPPVHQPDTNNMILCDQRELKRRINLRYRDVAKAVVWPEDPTCAANSGGSNKGTWSRNRTRRNTAPSSDLIARQYSRFGNKPIVINQSDQPLARGKNSINSNSHPHILSPLARPPRGPPSPSSASAIVFNSPPPPGTSRGNNDFYMTSSSSHAVYNHNRDSNISAASSGGSTSASAAVYASIRRQQRDSPSNSAIGDKASKASTISSASQSIATPLQVVYADGVVDIVTKRHSPIGVNSNGPAAGPVGASNYSNTSGGGYGSLGRFRAGRTPAFPNDEVARGANGLPSGVGLNAPHGVGGGGILSRRSPHNWSRGSHESFCSYINVDSPEYASIALPNGYNQDKASSSEVIPKHLPASASYHSGASGQPPALWQSIDSEPDLVITRL